MLKRRRVRKSKATAEFFHFKRRLYQRYGLFVNEHVIKEIIAAVKNNKCKFVGRQSIRITVWRVPLDLLQGLKKLNEHKNIPEGDSIVVVYDRERHQLVTCGDIIADGRFQTGDATGVDT